MRKPSIHCLSILALLLDGSDSADASNDELKTNSRMIDVNQRTTTKPDQKSKTIKGAKDRQLLLLEGDVPARKSPPIVSKHDLKFGYTPAWKDKILNPPSHSPTATPSMSNAPTGAPSSLPSNPPSVSSVPSEAPSLPISDSPSTGPSSSPTKTASYVPGKLTNLQNGLILSEGLQSRVIARTNQRVRLASGALSAEEFHEEPDGSAVFADPDTGGWIYVSNSEQMRGEGGVGAIAFDKDGGVIDYNTLLRGTSRNCSGGKTPWYAQFLSCSP